MVTNLLQNRLISSFYILVIQLISKKQQKTPLSAHLIKKRTTFALPKTQDCGTWDYETTKSPVSRVPKSRVKQQLND